MVRDRPYWKLTCESCMRCLNRCPERAIEAAHGMAVGFYFLIVAANTWIAIRFADIIGISPDATWWRIVTQMSSLLLTIVIPAFLYIIMHYAMQFKPLNDLVRFTSLTSLRFWRRYNPAKRKGKEIK
jgi:uncharacterized paraquat-inducible protein A